MNSNYVPLKITFDNILYELSLNKYAKAEIGNVSSLVLIRTYDNQHNLTQIILQDQESDSEQQLQQNINKINQCSPFKPSRRPPSRNQQIVNIAQQRTISQPQKNIVNHLQWFRYNQNISQQDLDVIDDQKSWLKSNMLDAIANKINYEVYQKYHTKMTWKEKQKLIHVFPTTVFQEMERQYHYRGYEPIIDCFQYAEELRFIQPIIPYLYSKFYFFINSNCHYILAEVDLQFSTVKFYDSLKMFFDRQIEVFRTIIQKILLKYNINLQLRYLYLHPNPRQRDANNCGIYAIYYLNQLIEKGYIDENTQIINISDERLRLRNALKKSNSKIKIVDQINYFKFQ